MQMFPSKTLNQILGSFNKTKAELQKLVEDNQAKQTNNDKIIDELTHNNMSMALDNQRAVKVVRKLEEFLGEKDETVNA